MNKGLELLSPETATVVPIKADPRLKLLFELEPRYIAFLDNIADLLSPPKLPPLNLTSPPGEFWPDVFVQTQKPWRSFQESVIWHFVAIIAIWTLSGKGLMLHKEPQTRNPLRDAQHITYYPPSRTYSAKASRPPAHQVDTRHRSQPRVSHQRPLEVAREARRPGGLLVPPDLKSAMARPDLPPSKTVAPSVPLSATTRSTTLPNGLTSVVAPPPDIKGSGRTGATLQTSVTAPPPDTGGISAGHTAVSPGAAVVAPPPTLQTWVRKIESLFGDSGGSGAVVPPPPSLSGSAGGRGGSLGNGSPQIVAPPPSVDGVGGPGGGRSLTTSASNIVPPPPSIQGVGGGRGNGVYSGGSQVVPPPPSLQGGSGTRGSIGSLAAGSGGIVPPPPGIQAVEGGRGGLLSAGSPNVVPPPVDARGGFGGTGVGGSRKSSLSGTGSDIVPPPPSMQGLGGGGNSQSASGAGPGGGARNRNALGGLGGDIVPPPPSFDRGSGGGSGGGKGRTAGMPGADSGIVPPPPSMQGVGTGGTGGRIKSLSAGSGAGVIPPPPSVSGAPGGTGRSASLSGAGPGSGVVPPPPTVAGEGEGGAGNGRLAGRGSAPGNGPVPPPPSTSGIGNGSGNGGSGNGPMTSLGGPASGAPPGGGPAAGGGGSGSTGPLQQMDDIPDANIAPNPNEPPPGPAEEFPLRLVSLALPTQGSSFFSNYEVYIAERRLPRGQSQLIKLVYTFLPYQKRLSEYIQSNARVYTLRVTRKAECDESLMQMTWSDASQDTGDMFPGTDKNTKLPCYVTTADDYQRALDHGR